VIVTTRCICIGKIVDAYTNLLQVVLARVTSGCFSRLLNGREKKADKYPNDGYDNEKFNQSESRS
jgi:hypothetical protein